MSRAIRRQQQQSATTKEKPARSLRSLGLRRPAAPKGPRQPASQQRRRFRIGVPRWLEEIISELKKVTWPTRQETIYLATVVIIVSITVGMMLGVIDIFFNWLIDRLLLR